MPQKLLPPAPDELEVSVFGPGYGESVLIHVGSGIWLAIDSCIDPVTGRSAPLGYLESLDIDPKTAIDLVVASHWHADHIRGLHELFSTASAAKFCCSSALCRKEFTALGKLYSGGKSRIPLGPEELYRCLETVSERIRTTGQSHLRWATADRLLWQYVSGGTPPSLVATLTSLSPSDSMISRSLKFMVDSSAAIKKGCVKARLTAGSPNDVAVALLLNINGRKILLGSDLEDEDNPLFGWSAVMSGMTAPGSRSGTFKVAHHGSVSGYLDDVWNTILEPEPLALLTPFRHGKHRIPNAADRARILSKTSQAYISAHPENVVRPAKKPTKIQGLMDGAIRNRRLAAGPIGHIRWRASICNPADKGTVDLFDGALALLDVV
ncbi:MBL fold metallo-hydrolase [Methylocaldum sp.]|uniref:MBL fold metallo-hydrolase n=1 Tax=Methylocaldum sp. TaxID=1969727 RepID=UPI002D4983B5|nr:MBL fold metallo-hydrolase [Methylocaldum sp.]HYE35376.1 MBL fold metallo-hydrolase [Methylocaldum sp.]